MISPNESAGGTAAAPMEAAVASLKSQTGCTDAVAESVFFALAQASAAVAMFIDRPSTRAAREATVALRQWAGPIADSALRDVIRLISAEAKNRLLCRALELYQEGCTK